MFRKGFVRNLKTKFDVWKQYFTLQDFGKVFSRNGDIRKLINDSLDMIIVRTTSNAYK